MALLNYKSMDCFHADEFCPYGKKNCLFSHGPDDQGSDSVGILFSLWAISWGRILRKVLAIS